MRNSIFGLTAAATLLIASPSLAIEVQPAPPGDAVKIATAAIRFAEHSCPRVKTAKRDRDGGIRAVCTNGETYLIARIKGAKPTFALKCSAARQIGVKC